MLPTVDGRPAAVLAVAFVAAACSAGSGELPETRTAPQEPPVEADGSTQPVASAVVHRVSPRLLGTEWERIPTSSRVIALTFDACGDDRGAAPILQTLVREQVPATFFLCGQWVDRYPGTARRIAASHAVGNHTRTHPHLTPLSDARVRDEIVGGATAIRRATKADPAPLFRFPYGDRNARTIAVVNGMGYGAIRWTVDTLGWQGAAAGRSAASVRARVLDAARPGAIVLMHLGAANDGTTLDASALPGVISALRGRGYRFVDLFRFAAVYRQTVDDRSPRFTAEPGWVGGARASAFGSTFRYAQPAAHPAPARFRVLVPQTSTYRVSAWWPAGTRNNAATPFVVETVAGPRVVRVDQRRNGGSWVSLGVFPLQAGDRPSVRVSRVAPGRGVVVADAVRTATP